MYLYTSLPNNSTRGKKLGKSVKITQHLPEKALVVTKSETEEGFRLFYFTFVVFLRSHCNKSCSHFQGGNSRFCLTQARRCHELLPTQDHLSSSSSACPRDKEQEIRDEEIRDEEIRDKEEERRNHTAICLCSFNSWWTQPAQ